MHRRTVETGFQSTDIYHASELDQANQLIEICTETSLPKVQNEKWGFKQRRLKSNECR